MKKLLNKIYYAFLAIIVSLSLTGCNAIVLNPKGMIGKAEKELIIIALLLMLIVVIPAILLTFIFAWKYRATNPNLKYAPNWHHSNKVEVVVWSVPIVIILILATITWKSTHKLDPYRPIIVPSVKPLTIEVVALDWKWLFIYPEEGIATINYIRFPVNVPVDFKVTADAPMNAFMIPQLGGQIYAMAGMQTHLHLIADTQGKYAGRSVSFSGAGFYGMTFTADVGTLKDYQEWVKEVKKSSDQLSPSVYYQLVKPSTNEPIKYFSTVKPHLYDNIIMKYMMPGMQDLNVDHSLMHM